MFIFKESTEIITFDNEINVVGLSLQKSGLPMSFDSLGKLWERYGSDYRGRGRTENVAAPYTEYGVAINSIPDYITGCGVEKIGAFDDKSASFVIPAGKYIKDFFNAESFEALVYDEIMKRNVAAWAEKNSVKIDERFSVEVYPRSKFDNGIFEMYTLTPIEK